MSNFQFSCINCGSHISRQSSNLDAGIEKSCWLCNTINIVPDLTDATATATIEVDNESKLRRCSNCQTILEDDSNHCTYCGTPLQANEIIKYCSECGDEYDNDDNIKYCANDGNELLRRGDQRKKVKSKKMTKRNKKKKQTNLLMGFIMVVAYFHSVASLISYFVGFRTYLIPNGADGATALVMSALTFLLGYGIHHRKSWGLYYIYFLCIVGSMQCIALVFDRKSEYFFALIVYCLYAIYFNKSKHLFTK